MSFEYLTFPLRAPFEIYIYEPTLPRFNFVSILRGLFMPRRRFLFLALKLMNVLRWAVGVDYRCQWSLGPASTTWYMYVCFGKYILSKPAKCILMSINLSNRAPDKPPIQYTHYLWTAKKAKSQYWIWNQYARIHTHTHIYYSWARKCAHICLELSFCCWELFAFC